MAKSARTSGFVHPKRLATGETALYSKLRIPDPSRPSGYRTENRLIGRLWTRGGRPPAGYVTKRGAQDLLRERIVDAGRRAGDAPERAPAPIFEEVAAEWLRAKARRDDGVRVRTWRDYRAIVNTHLLPTFGRRPVDEIRPADVEAFKEAQLERGVSARSVVRQLMVAGQVFGHAVRRHGLASNPARAEAVPRPRVKYDRSRFAVLAPAQVRAVAAAMPGQHGRAAVLVAAWTGVRKGELIELRWRDVLWGDQRLHVRRAYSPDEDVKTTKGGHGRSVPMIPDLVALLDGLSRRDHSTGDDDLVLVNERGGRLCGHTLTRQFYAALRAAGLGHLREADPPLRFHDLRHTFATLAVKVKPLSDVQALCGHADISTTMRYVHYVPGARDAELLASAFADDDGAPSLLSSSLAAFRVAAET
jgi:integrase